MKETASELAKRLMEELTNATKTSYSRGEVKTILNQFVAAQFRIDHIEERDVSCRGTAKVTRVQRGDVFIAKAIGGKPRPWIALKVIGDVVTALPISSGDSVPNMIKSQCRLWPSNWIGSTISQFRMDIATAEVSRPYTNIKHLREVEQQIAANMGMRPFRPRKKTMTEIAETVRTGR